MTDKIGIGAVVTHRPLPHHRAYGSVHGGSIGYANSPRLMTEDRGTGSRHSTVRPRELWTGPNTTVRDRCRRCYALAADALPGRSVPRDDDGKFSSFLSRICGSMLPLEVGQACDIARFPSLDRCGNHKIFSSPLGFCCSGLLPHH